MFGLLPQLLIQLLLLKGTHGCYCAKGHWDYAKVKCIIKDKPTTKPVEQTTQRASTRPHRPPQGTTKETTSPPILTLTSIHIELATWDSWSSCPKSCGTRGVQWRRRTCKDSTRYVLYRAEQIMSMVAMMAMWIITLRITMMVKLMMPGNAKLAKGKGISVQPRLAQVNL